MKEIVPANAKCQAIQPEGEDFRAEGDWRRVVTWMSNFFCLIFRTFLN